MKSDTGIRQTNIELLRIISMLMVLCVHFTGATFGLPSKVALEDLKDLNIMSKTLMECFSIIGVNCFVLISGYFGIRPTVKGIVNFIICCVFYSLAIYSLFIFIEPKNYDYNDLLESVLIFSNTDLWFVPAYFSLYIISPLINRGIQKLDSRSYIWLLVSLSFINIYLGWFWHGKVNPNGYTVMQMIYVYLIGAFLRRKNSIIFGKTNKLIVCYILSFSLLFISTFICPSSMAYAYNSPFVLLSSICFFCIFASFRYTNRQVNYISASAFSVYLIHKMPPIWLNLKEFMITNTKNLDDSLFVLFWISFVLMIFATCISIDKIRIALLMPISKWIIARISRFV